MVRNRLIAGLVLCAGVVCGDAASGQTPDQPTVRVRLYDDVGLPMDTVERAKREAVLLFGRSQMNLEWIEDRSIQPRPLMVRIIAKPIGLKSRNRGVVGIAPGSREARGIIAFVFFERIQDFSTGLSLDLSQMLGHVMAHELGHLLLPYDAHSASGVMRGAWDRRQAGDAAAGRLTFTPVQAALILERLQASASRIAYAR